LFLPADDDHVRLHHVQIVQFDVDRETKGLHVLPAKCVIKAYISAATTCWCRIVGAGDIAYASPSTISQRSSSGHVR